MELKIQNENQRRVTEEQIGFMQSLIDDLRANPHPEALVHPQIALAEIAGIQSLLDEMREDCAIYDAAQIGKEYR
jgi:hypothetical protein